MIASKSLGKDAAAEARVGLAGPVAGSIATLVPLGIWLATGSEFWRALAYLGFFLNLFNLLPVVPLDGGRAIAFQGGYTSASAALVPAEEAPSPAQV
ncbi:MAG: site-2 protease family protein [Solirubrobacterales bacterium]